MQMSNSYIVFEFKDLKGNLATYFNSVEKMYAAGYMKNNTTLRSAMTVQELKNELEDIEVWRHDNNYVGNTIDMIPDIKPTHNYDWMGNILNALLLIGTLIFILYMVDNPPPNVVVTHKTGQ